MLNRIDAYIVRQYVFTFFFILGMVLSISILVDFVEKLDEFIDKDPPTEEIIFDYYLNFIPFWANLLAPLCIYLSVIFFTSRMAGRTEIIPMLGAGISYFRILLPYIAVSILLAGLAYYGKSYVIPVSTAARIEFEYKYLKKRRISSNKHVHKKVARDTYVYMSYYNNRQREGHTFALERIVDGEIVTKIQSRKIIWVDSTQSWRLEKVKFRYFDGLQERIHSQARLDTTFLLAPDDIYIKEQKAESMTLPELIEYTRLEEMRGSDILKELYIERYRRYADPVAIIILTLIGFAMSTRKSRGGVALQIGLGLLISFAFIALLFAGQAFVSDTFPAWLAVWMPNIVFFPVALFLLWLAPK